MDDLLKRFDGRLIITLGNITGFADDFSGIARNKNKNKARKESQKALDEAVRWATSHGLEFSHEKN